MGQTTFSGPVKSNNGFLFDTTTTGTDVEGAIVWNSESQTLDIGLGNQVSLQVGQELYFLARNNTGSTIPNGSAVQFSGALGNSGRVTVQLALASPSSPAEYLMGIATQDIANDEDGFVTFFGKVRGIDTRGGAENWQDGDLLYLSGDTAGALTKVPPTSPTPDVLVAAVVNAAPNGILLVRPTFPASISLLSDVIVTNPQPNDILVYNGSVWVNQAPA